MSETRKNNRRERKDKRGLYALAGVLLSGSVLSGGALLLNNDPTPKTAMASLQEELEHTRVTSSAYSEYIVADANRLIACVAAGKLASGKSNGVTIQGFGHEAATWNASVLNPDKNVSVSVGWDAGRHITGWSFQVINNAYAMVEGGDGKLVVTGTSSPTDQVESVMDGVLNALLEPECPRAPGDPLPPAGGSPYLQPA